MKLQTINSGKTYILTTTKSQFIDGIVYNSEIHFLEVFMDGTCYSYYCDKADFARVVGVTKIENSLGKAFHKVIRNDLKFINKYNKDFKYRKTDHGFFVETLENGTSVVHCDSSFITKAIYHPQAKCLIVAIGGKNYRYHCTTEEFEMFIGCAVFNKSIGYSFNKMVKSCLATK